MGDKKKLRVYLKTKHDLAAGEVTLKKVSDEISELAKTKIKISGRSYKTGNRKTVNVTFKDLLGA